MNEPVAGFRCGTVALVGRPNVGKSTLLNALVGAHLSITADKPQTTRHRILGVRTEADGQLVLVDTPGLHRGGKRALNRQINQTAQSALADVDVVVWLLDCTRIGAEDQWVESLLKPLNKPLLIVLNKVDKLTDKARLLPLLTDYQQRWPAATIIPLSALKRDTGVERLVRAALRLLPEQPAWFDADTLTDRSERFLATEYVREQLIRRLGEELPYATTVTVDRFVTEGRLRRIDATIWVERDGQKAIVIGDGGARLKEIGSHARKRMETQWDGKVMLTLWVKVKAGWSDSDTALAQLGYVEQ